MQDIGFGIFCFVLLLFSVAYVFFNIGIVHASPKFESQKMIYKQDTEFEIFSSLANCFHLYFIVINFNHDFFILWIILLMNTLNQFNLQLFATSNFVKETVIPYFTKFVNKYKIGALFT